jgi:NifU-like protein involved in Fe-S cluster formation
MRMETLAAEEAAMAPTREDLLKDIGYSDKSIRFIQDEHKLGVLPAFSTRTSHVGQCGDMLRLYLDVDGRKIRKASYELTGCAGLQACASGMASMVEGLTLDEARRIDTEEIIAFLGGLPEAKLDCAELARDTLRKAIDEVEQDG